MLSGKHVLIAAVCLCAAVLFLFVDRRSTHLATTTDVSGTSAVSAPNAESVTAAETHAETPVELARRFATIVHGEASGKFYAWVSDYLSAEVGERPRLAAEGRRLAEARRPEFRELIREDPRRALEEAIPMVVRQALPEMIVERLEARLNGVAAFRVLQGVPMPGEPAPAKSLTFREAEFRDGKTYRAYVYGGRAARVEWTAGASLNGVAIDADFAVNESPSRTLEVGERPPKAKKSVVNCPVSGKQALAQDEVPAAISEATPAVETAEEVVYFCSNVHINHYNQTLIMGEGVSGGAFGFTGILPAAPTPAIGVVKVLAIPMTYADQNTVPSTEAALYSTFRDVSDFYSKASFGRLTLVGVVSPPVKLTHNEAWYVNRDMTNGGDISGTSLEHAEARDEARKLGFDSNNYDCIVVRHNGGPGAYGGLGGGSSVWVRSDSASLWAHEIGHCFALAHANFWDTAGTSSIGAGTNQEYGDSYDNMGSAPFPAGQYNAQAKSQVKWLPPNFVQSVAQSGTYRVYAMDVGALDPSRRYALTVLKDSQRTYWGEVRSLFDTNPWVKNGMLLGWRYPNGGGSNVQLIDTTPGSPFSKEDAPVSLGSTFSDFETGIHLTTVAFNDSPRFVDVVVNLGDFSANGRPTLALAASAEVVPVGATVTFTATAADPDGDVLAYSWQNFGDTSVKIVSPNAPVITRTFPTAGTYIVTCTVSDMKGGTSARSRQITVGNGNSRFTISGRVTLVGAGLQDVVITANGANGVVTDADGYFTIPNLSANTYTLTPLLYGYSFGELFDNSIVVGPSYSGADFEAAASPTVTISALVPTAGEQAPVTPGRFKISRSGDTSQSLTVNVNAALGSATKATDYTFAPDYVAGSQGFSTFTIPEDADSLEIVVAPVVDALQEGPETVVLQLGPGTGYVVGGQSAATVVIDDDDTTLPKIAVAAPSPDTTENGPQPGVFTFTRVPVTNAALVVNYTVAGTAVSGVDFAPLSGTAVIAANAASATVNIAPLNDATSEPLETVTLKTTLDSAYLIDPLAPTATVNLTDDDLQTVTVAATDAAAREVDLSAPAAAADTGTFVVSRTGDASAPLTVYYAFAGTQGTGVSALHGADFEAMPGSVVIPAGQSQASITILPRFDTIGEGPENVVLVLGAAATNYILGSASSATVTIADGASDLPYVNVVNTTSASEPGTTGTFRITVRGGSGTGALAVNYSLSGSATIVDDFNITGTNNTPTGTTITQNNGATVTKDVIVTPVDDATLEDLENVTLTIAPSAAYQSFQPTAAATMWLRDNDQPTVYVDTQVSTNRSVTVTEGTVSNPTKFYVSRTGSNVAALTVNYTVGGTATNGSDYTALPGSITIPAGATGVDVPVVITNDTTFEGTETIAFDFAPGSYSRGPGTVMYVADNETSTQRVGFANASSAALESAGSVSIPVSLTTPATTPVSVEYLVDGAAASSSSVAAPATNATLPYWIRATKSSTTFSMWMSVDGVTWLQMGSNLTLSNFNVTNPLVGLAVGSGTSGQACNATFDNVSVTNLAPGGTAGTAVETTIGTTTPVSTSSNAAGVYSLSAGGPSIASGATTDAFRYVYFPVTNSNSCTITARVVSLVGGGANSRAGVMIRNGTGANVVQYSTLVGGDFRSFQVSRSSGGAGNAQTAFAPIMKPYWLRVERLGNVWRSFGSADGATFTALGTPQTIVTGPEVLVGLIVSSRQDGVLSAATFDNVTITPAPPGGVVLARRSVGFVNESGTYAEAGGVHSLSGSGAAIGNSGTDEGDLAAMSLTGNFVLTARVTSQSGGANNAQAGLTIRENGDKDARMIYLGLTANFGVEHLYRFRTRTTAFGSGVDFDLPPGVLNFAIGEQTKDIVVPITNDSTNEADEVFSVTLRNSNGAQLGTTTIFNHTIEDDDSAPASPFVGFAAGASSVEEGAGAASLLVSLSAPASATVSIDYAVSGGTATGGGTDYTLAAGTLTFAPGESVKVIPVTITDDLEIDTGETVIVTLSAPSGAQMGSLSAHTLSITDNDLPVITIVANDPSAAEAGLAPGQFTISRTGPIATALNVTLAWAGTAVSGSDYVALAAATPFTFTIPVNASSATIDVAPLADVTSEGSETVIVSVNAAAGYSVGAPASATVVIADDDRSTVTLVANDADASETAGNPGQFTVTRTAPTTGALTVNLSISGTASNGSDYTSVSSTVSFSAGQSSRTVNITPTNDAAIEGPEQVTISLASGSYDIGAEFFDNVTIADNDSPPTLFISSPTAQGPLIANGNGVIVSAAISDDGAPAPVSQLWTQVSGPGVATIESPTEATTAVTFSAPGTYTLRITATDTQFTVTDQVTVVVGAGLVAADWFTQDLGPSSQRRGQGLEFGGQFTVTGTGAGYAGTSDQAHVMVRQVSGDGSVVARLTSLPVSTALAGVTIRDAMARGARRAVLGYVPGSGLQFRVRNTVSTSDTLVATQTGLALPLWLKLERNATTGEVTASHAADVAGSPGAWVQLGASTAITMDAAAHFGLTTTNNSTAGSATGVFDHVTLTPAPVGPALLSEDAGTTPTAPGSGSSSSGTYTVAGSPTGYFHGWQYYGDMVVTARLASFSSGAGSAIGGIRVAESMEAGAYAHMGRIPQGAYSGYVWTSIAGGSGGGVPSATLAGNWIRIIRKGNSITAFRAPDVAGSPGTWIPIGQPQTVIMTTPIFVGFYVNNSSGVGLNTCTFTGLSIAPLNAAPNVNITAPAPFTISPLALDASVMDDNFPAPPAVVTSWSKRSGPGAATFANPATIDTGVTLSVAGDYVLRLHADDGSVQSFRDLVVTGYLTGFDVWRGQQWAGSGGLNNPDSLPLADPDDDGNANLLEYGLGTSPIVGSAAPIATDYVTIGSDTFLRMTVTKNPVATGLQFVVEGRDALSGPLPWSSAGLFIEENSAAVLRVRDHVPLGSTPERYLRLRVNLP